nr:hypothetical protein [Tanacetum cinerariifolium]
MEDPYDYPADRGDNDDDKSSNDDEDDDDVEKDKEDKEEEEHPAPADPSDVSTDDLCNRFGHLARDCKSSIKANTTDIQKGTGASQKATCYECGTKGTIREIVRSKRTKTMKTRGVVHPFGGGETKQDLNNIEDEIEA